MNIGSGGMNWICSITDHHDDEPTVEKWPKSQKKWSEVKLLIQHTTVIFQNYKSSPETFRYIKL